MYRNYFFLLTALMLPFFLIITVIFFAAEPLLAEELIEDIDSEGNLRIYNEYIAVVVNTEENARGRFAVETTGGDPGTEEDENMPLIYGRPVPWTSYTTIKIDGEEFAFGGETERRAGANAGYGEELQPPEVENETILTAYQLEDLEVEQRLEIIESTTTGLPDTARIEYVLTNTGDSSKEVGLRIMLDTMLGEVDGSPFRVEEEAVETDARLTHDELPSFYQSFDSLTDPQITSQGAFVGEHVDTPDRVYMSNWGSLADGPWNFNFEPGREFLREGEFEIDSAIALYWDPVTVEPGETISYATSYGLGGVSKVPGMLSLGISAPREFTFSPETPELPIVGYIENTAGLTAENVSAELNLPDFLQAEDHIRDLGDLDEGEVAQVNYYVEPLTEDLPDDFSFAIEASADNTDTNIAEGHVDLLDPAMLDVNLDIAEPVRVVDGSLKPLPITLRAELENVGEAPFRNFVGELITPPGFEFAKYERPEKRSFSIEAGEKFTINWRLHPHDIEGDFPFALQIEGDGDYSETVRRSVDIPGTSPGIFFNIDRSSSDRDIITAKIGANKLVDEIEVIEFDLNYNENLVDYVYSSRGTLFVRDERLMAWDGPAEIDENSISFSLLLPDGVSSGGLAQIRFSLEEKDKDLDDLKESFSLENVKAYDSDGEEIELSIF